MVTATAISTLSLEIGPMRLSTSISTSAKTAMPSVGRCVCGRKLSVSQTSPRNEPLLPLGMPSSMFSCDSAMMIAAAFMKPKITGCETKLTIVPSLKAPSANCMIPTIKVSSNANSMNSAEKGAANGVIAAAVIKEMIATGPVESWRDEPHSAPMMAGTSATYRPK